MTWSPRVAAVASWRSRVASKAGGGDVAQAKKDDQGFVCAVAGCESTTPAARGFCTSCYHKARRLVEAGATWEEIKARRSLEPTHAEEPELDAADSEPELAPESMGGGHTGSGGVQSGSLTIVGGPVEDVESLAIAELVRSLLALDGPARSRVLAYASSRFGDA